MKQEKEWLESLIDTSEMCSLNRKFSEEYDKLMFQLEYRLKLLKRAKTP